MLKILKMTGAHVGKTYFYKPPAKTGSGFIFYAKNLTDLKF